jgi:hypothetical protein
MTYTRKLIQTRPNKNVNFFTPGSDINNLIETYKNSGKILEYTNITTDDELSNIITLKFINVTEFGIFSVESIVDASAHARYAHCLNNHISYSIESIP